MIDQVGYIDAGAGRDNKADGTRGPEQPSEMEKARKHILRERARKLARPKQDAMEWENLAMVVEFVLSRERYVLDAEYVHEIAPLDEIVQLPGTPDFILGIINLRGEIRSVVDLRKIFNLPEIGEEERKYALILRNEEMEFGLFADEVPGVDVLDLETVQETLPTLTDVRADYLKGVTNDGVVYLDADKLLSDEKITIINR